MYKKDLALNNLEGFIGHKTQPNKSYIFNALSAGAVEYADCTSAEG